MSKHQRNAAGALVALAALGATAGLAPAEGDPGELPDAADASNDPAPPPEVDAPARPRALFDASYVCSVDGRRTTFSPGDPVPDHIDPASLPAGSWRAAPEEG